MKSYLDPVTIGGIALKNRTIRSATFEYGADASGRHTDIHRKLYENLARGGVGAIITGMVAVNPDSRLKDSMVRAYTDEFEGDLRDICNLLQPHDCPVIVQISHCGVKAQMPEKAGEPVGPSAHTLSTGVTSRAMTHDEIRSAVASFADVAAKCQRAGAAAVQIHGAHGYGICQFLSPYFNKRTDAYGGSIENRSRFLMEVYDAIRARVGAAYPVWIKINATDLTEPGLSFEESLWVCKELEKRGIDAIEYSAGVNEGPQSLSARMIKKGDGEGYLASYAQTLARQIQTPVISVGGYRTPEGMDKWLNTGNLEYLSLCRPLIAEPGLINRWKSGDKERARCISCNKCYTSQDGLTCQVFGR